LGGNYTKASNSRKAQFLLRRKGSLYVPYVFSVQCAALIVTLRKLPAPKKPYPTRLAIDFNQSHRHRMNFPLDARL
jgi:hypothetical protein